MKKIMILVVTLVMAGFVLPTSAFSDTLTVTPTNINLYEGTQYGIAISGGTGPYAARSSDNSVVSVFVNPFQVGDATGTLTGVAKGFAIITITDNSTAESVNIEVTVTAEITDSPAQILSPVYRFYSTVTGQHFYTISENEKDIVIANPSWGYVYEGIAWWAYANEKE